jgi:hypothetical protein
MCRTLSLCAKALLTCRLSFLFPHFLSLMSQA